MIDTVPVHTATKAQAIFIALLAQIFSVTLTFTTPTFSLTGNT